MELKFAAFIMTYERPGILPDTIAKIFGQTYPPEKILIVDNSESPDTEQVIAGLNDSRLQYHRVGYNAGPAGAAKIGLQNLANEGYDWIYWGDDNDPPRTFDAFEKIKEIINDSNKTTLGAVALMGNNFNLKIAKTIKFKLNQLKGVLSVNSIAGGGTMVFNTALIKQGILPNDSLFFGYEELEFCLKIKKAGFDILVDGDYYYQLKIESIKPERSRFEKIGFNLRENCLWREYYSVRNMLYILHSNSAHSGMILFCLRLIFKVFFSFSKGYKFGIRYTKIIFNGLKDFNQKKFGMTLVPENYDILL
jgi:GT2 family glycosyltransferase